MAAKFPEFDILALALAPLDLPMQDLDDQEDFALSKKENEERFGAPVRDNDLARAIEERIPDKTKKTTQWAYSVWQSWCEVRCVTHDVAVSNALQPPPQKAEEKKLDDGQQACCSYSAHRSQPQNIDCTLVPQGVSINISINQ